MHSRRLCPHLSHSATGSATSLEQSSPWRNMGQSHLQPGWCHTVQTAQQTPPPRAHDTHTVNGGQISLCQTTTNCGVANFNLMPATCLHAANAARTTRAASNTWTGRESVPTPYLPSSSLQVPCAVQLPGHALPCASSTCETQQRRTIPWLSHCHRGAHRRNRPAAVRCRRWRLPVAVTPTWDPSSTSTTRPQAAALPALVVRRSLMALATAARHLAVANTRPCVLEILVAEGAELWGVGIVHACRAVAKAWLGFALLGVASLDPGGGGPPHTTRSTGGCLLPSIPGEVPGTACPCTQDSCVVLQVWLACRLMAGQEMGGWRLGLTG